MYYVHDIQIQIQKIRKRDKQLSYWKQGQISHLMLYSVKKIKQQAHNSWTKNLNLVLLNCKMKSPYINSIFLQPVFLNEIWSLLIFNSIKLEYREWKYQWLNFNPRNLSSYFLLNGITNFFFSYTTYW